MIDMEESLVGAGNMDGKNNYFLAYSKTNFFMVSTWTSNHMVWNIELLASSSVVLLSKQNNVNLPNGNFSTINNKGSCIRLVPLNYLLFISHNLYITFDLSQNWPET